MNEILIYLGNPEDAAEVRQVFSNIRYKITPVDNLEMALEICQHELFDLALVWDADRDKVSEFLEALAGNGYTYIPVAVVGNNPEELSDMQDLAVLDLIKMPLPREAFFHILDQIILDVDSQSTVVDGMNWQGSVEEYNLIDLIQMLETSERDSELIFNHGPFTGNVYFRGGKVINAQLGSLKGMPALQKLAVWPVGNFRTKLTEIDQVEETIDKSNQDILMELMSIVLKQGRLDQGLPELTEEIVKNPLNEKKQLTPLQDRIFSFCQKPISVFELMLNLDESNEDILLELKILLQIGVVGRRQDVESLVRQSEAQSGIGKFFSSLFGRKPEHEQVDFSMHYEEPYEDEVQHPKIEIMPLNLAADDRTKIEKMLEERYQ